MKPALLFFLFVIIFSTSFAQSQFLPDTIPGTALSINADWQDGIPVQSVNTNTFTISSWIKPSGSQLSGSAIFSWSTGIFYISQTDNDNLLECSWNTPDYPGYTDWNSGLTVPPNQWSYIAMVVTPDSITLYLNDQKATHINTNPISVIDNYVFANSNQLDNGFNGLIDEFTIWNRSLSENEVDSFRHLTKEKTVNRDSSLLAYFQFNDPLAKGSINAVNGSSFTFAGKSERKVTSTVPVGSGVSEVQKITEGGAYSFGNTGVILTFPSSGIYPNGNVWITKINQLPDSLTQRDTLVGGAYYIIDNKGSNNIFTNISAIQFNGFNLFESEKLPGALTLQERGLYQDGNKWSPACGVSSVEGNSILFNNTCDSSAVQLYISHVPPVVSIVIDSPIVKIVSLTAKEQGQQIILNWLVENESNIYEYIIERSVDSSNYFPIGYVNPENLSGYSFIDRSPVNGKDYYRLKIVAVNYYYSYSEAVSAIANITNLTTGPFMILMPNPVQQNQQLKILNTAKSDATITFYSTSGSKIGQYNVPANTQIQISKLPVGVIFYKTINKDSQSLRGKIIVK